MSDRCEEYLQAHPMLSYLGGILTGIVLSVLFRTVDRGIVTTSAVAIVLGAAVVWLSSRHADKSGSRLLDPENYYRDFFDNAIEGIFCSTPDGRYIVANAALAKIYGYPSREVLAADMTDIASQLYVDPNRRTAFKAILAAEDRVAGFVSEIRRLDGSTIWISENAHAVRNRAGQVVCYVGTVEDVSARIGAQRLQKALAEAEEINRTKGAFLATMTHELRTPLNAIIGFSEILEAERLGPLTPAAYRDYVTDIRVSGVRLLGIVNDILDASRLECGAIELYPAPVDISALIAEAVSLARTQRDGTRRITVEIAPALPDFLIDCKRFRQCVVNVLTNAMKFTPTDGNIAVSARCDDGGLRLSVRDNGIGMDTDKLDHLSRPFHQLDGALSRRFDGIGLGLYITKALIDLHGGRLEIDSVVGRGTTVCLLLPPERTL